MLHTAAKSYAASSAARRPRSLHLAPTSRCNPQQRVCGVLHAQEPSKSPKDPHQVAHKDVENAARQERNSDVFDRIGGKDAMVAAVDRFYDKVLADDRVNGFFKGVDMNKQRSKQMKFMMFAFGGPNEYQGRDMYTAHHGMHLTEEHFNAIAEHFTATLDELGIAPEVIRDAVKVVATTHDDIVGH